MKASSQFSSKWPYTSSPLIHILYAMVEHTAPYRLPAAIWRKSWWPRQTRDKATTTADVAATTGGHMRMAGISESEECIGNVVDARTTEPA